MHSESILLVGRETRNARELLETHADRLARRDIADGVEVATYEREPVRELRDRFEALDADTVYAVPMRAAHTYETVGGVPAALSYVPGDVRVCEPLGRSPAVTEVVEERGAEHLSAADDASLVLVAFGSSSKPYHRQTAEYHAARLREHSDYGEVLTCFLLQNPAVECVRYNVTKDRSVAVPLFMSRTEATERRIPEGLELARGGIEYADPLGAHPRITDAVHAEVEKQRVLGLNDDGATTVSLGEGLTGTPRPVATDGEGRRR
jgi:sirohydrochlorin ferrochelatase